MRFYTLINLWHQSSDEFKSIVIYCLIFLAGPRSHIDSSMINLIIIDQNCRRWLIRLLIIESSSGAHPRGQVVRPHRAPRKRGPIQEISF